MVAWRSSGDVLRWWRSDVLALTQQDAADRLNVKSSALSNWERGTRAISLDLSVVDEALKGERALEGLLWGHGTPEGIEPGHLWSKVFPPPSRPVWVWLRSPAERLMIQAEWGVARLELDIELPPNGLFLTVAVAINDSPVVIHLSEPAWADFGFGELPDSIPDATVIDAVTLLQRSSADGTFMELFSASLASKLTARDPEAIDLANSVPAAIVSYMDGLGQLRSGTMPHRRWPPEPEGIQAVERERFARLREARDLSLSSLAERVSNHTGVDVGRDTLRRFETDVGQPHDPMLPVALDHVLGAGGRLALLELRAGRGNGATWFPPYWRGPMWVEFVDDEAEDDKADDDPDDDDDPDVAGRTHVVLHRGSWYREVRFTGRLLVAAHWFDPSTPLRIEADAGTSWTAGVGRRFGAEAVDQNWVPGGVDVAQKALAETEQAIFDSLDRRHEK